MLNGGADLGLGIIETGYPTVERVDCHSGRSLAAAALVRGRLSFEDGRYTYTIKSDKAWAGTCRRVSVRLTDGTDHQMTLKFKRKHR